MTQSDLVLRPFLTPRATLWLELKTLVARLILGWDLWNEPIALTSVSIRALSTPAMDPTDVKCLRARCGTAGLYQVSNARVSHPLARQLMPPRRYKAKLHVETAEADAPSPHLPPGPKKDYSLKEGQTFTINLPGRGSQTSSLNTSGNSSTSSGASIPLLPPPPSGTKRR